MMWSEYGGWGWWGPGFLPMIGFWIVLIVAVFLLMRGLGGAMGRSHRECLSGETALDILRKRYARGEIDKEEFEGKKRDLAD
jgi:putative membrane protein